ncbi:MAG: hypothetical protein HUU01_01810 [Saprospiraceae bacterium]|nr:hypothetical protein [Saprospiraceae bacterium]
MRYVAKNGSKNHLDAGWAILWYATTIVAQISILVMVKPRTVLVKAFLFAFAADRFAEKKIKALRAMKNNRLIQESRLCG